MGPRGLGGGAQHCIGSFALQLRAIRRAKDEFADERLRRSSGSQQVLDGRAPQFRGSADQVGRNRIAVGNERLSHIGHAQHHPSRIVHPPILRLQDKWRPDERLDVSTVGRKHCLDQRARNGCFRRVRVPHPSVSACCFLQKHFQPKRIVEPLLTWEAVGRDLSRGRLEQFPQPQIEPAIDRLDGIQELGPTELGATDAMLLSAAQSQDDGGVRSCRELPQHRVVIPVQHIAQRSLGQIVADAPQSAK